MGSDWNGHIGTSADGFEGVQGASTEDSASKTVTQMPK